MNGVLERFAYHPEATLGKLTINDEVFWIAERPWRGNKKNVSCVPVGEYICNRYKSKKFGETFQLMGVPNRTYILFHVGNYPEKDSQGCLLVGDKLMAGTPAVGSSKKAMTRFRKLLKDVETFGLKIKDRFPYDWSE
jgi:hypothetical protein